MASITDRPRARLSRKQIRQRLRTARRQQARKARVARRRLQQIQDQLPKQVRTIFDPVEPVFSRPTHRRFVLLALAAILTLGGRTITNLVRVLGVLAPGHLRVCESITKTPKSTSAYASQLQFPPRFASINVGRFVAQGRLIHRL